jgi:O-antigen/teichoic acid export membrane protein
LALPIAVGAATLADQIVPFLFKAAYLPAVPALQIVIWVVPLMFASEFLGYVVLIAGDERRAARAVVASTGFNVVLNLLVVPRFGFLGAAMMTVLTEAVLVGQYVWMLRGQMRQLDWGRVLLRPLLAALLMGGLVLALRGLPLLVNVALGGLAYAGLLLLLGVVGRDELRFVRGLRRGAESSVSL